MSLIRTTIIASVALAATVGTASAHGTKRIENIQANQRAAIESGRWAGSITKREQRALIAEQERIDTLRRRAKADGHVSTREARAIRHAQKEARAHISEDRNNGRVNIWRRWKSRHGI